MVDTTLDRSLRPDTYYFTVSVPGLLREIADSLKSMTVLMERRNLELTLIEGRMKETAEGIMGVNITLSDTRAVLEDILEKVDTPRVEIQPEDISYPAIEGGSG